DGGKILQETRLYDADRDETRSMRSKEDAHDYRYFPDPDLLPLEVTEQWIEGVRAAMPELPQAIRQAFVTRYELTPYQAAQLPSSTKTSSFSTRVFESAASSARASHLANWITGTLAARLNDEN